MEFPVTWIGSLPLENCIPGNAPWLGSLDAIVVGSLSPCGLGRPFPDDDLRVSPAITTGADLSGAAASGATAGVAVSAAATGITGAGDAVAAATGGTGAGATTTAGGAGETIPAVAPDSIETGGGRLATGAGDGSADGIGSDFVVGSTRTSDG